MNIHTGNVLKHLRYPPEYLVTATLALTVGLLTAIGVFLFRFTFEELHTFIFETLAGEFAKQFPDIPVGILFIIILVIGGAFIGWMTHRYIAHEKYHGVAAIIASVAYTGGRMPLRAWPFKTIASILSLGFGASVGPEDPSVQIGANIASGLGGFLKLGEERRRLLVAAGSASAIAAAFNAPIAGVFFAMEVILGEFTSTSFGVVVLSAVLAAAFDSAFGNFGTIFDNLNYQLGSPVQLIFFAFLGIILVPVAVFSLRFFDWNSEFWHKIRLSPPAKTALAGLIIGIVGLFLPQLLGTGEHYMHDILLGDANPDLIILIFLGFGKIILTSISVSSGFVGGMFAPTLFIGIMLGNAYGQIVSHLAPVSVVGTHQSYAIAGMAAMLAAIVRSPITAVLLVFELTDDYLLILPIMLTSVLSMIIMEQLGIPGIYHYNLEKGGVYIAEGREVDVMQGVKVREVMHKPAPSISRSASLNDLRRAFTHQRTRGLCVLNENQQLCGIVTLSDLQKFFNEYNQDPEKISQATVADVLTADVISVNSEMSMWEAIRLMGVHELGRMPVLQEGELVGMVQRHNITDAYNTAIQRKLESQIVREQIRLNTLTGAHVIEVHVKDGARVVNTKIRDLHLPPETVIASIHRKNRLIVPSGETFIRAGDEIAIVIDPDYEEKVIGIFEHKARPADKPEQPKKDN